MDSIKKKSEGVYDTLNLAKKLKIDVKQKLQPPQIAWQLKNLKSPGDSILGTLGNFSLVTGKAKSGKSFFMNIAVSTAVSNDFILDRFKSNLPKDQNEVLYFDTEQGKYHVQLALKRICRQINIEVPTNLHVYHLRSQPPKVRLEIIEELIKDNSNVGFVVIDGIKDLVTSINNEEEASDVTSRLLKWTEERNIHIVTVLHQNPSNIKARGHLGTELVNKAETVLAVIKENNIFCVETTESRNKPAESFAFQIIEDLPVIVKNYEFNKSSTSSSRELDDLQKQQILQNIFTSGDNFAYKQLVNQLKLSHKFLFNKTIGDNKAKDLVSYFKNNGWLVQEKEKMPYTIGVFKDDS